MKLDQVGIQLYTLRDFITTPDDLDTTLERVRGIGYPAAQLSGMSAGMLPPADVKALFEKHRVTLCATHASGETLLNDPGAVVTELKALGCTHTAYPYPAGIDFGSVDAVDAFIARLDQSGKVLADAGLTLSYHNHNHEFRKLEGKPILERIYARTDPRYLQAELDTYWIQYGGGDPVAWCRNMAGRMPVMHLKDFKVTDDNGIAFAEIGEGNLDFRAIVDAASESGCRWFIVEQDQCDGDPFDAIARSLEYIEKYLVN